MLTTLPDNVAPCRWADQGFKYLGIFITGFLTDTFESNFVPLLKKVGEDLQRWSSLPLSLAGRINLIKMTILPKFLYLFQHIPVLISNNFFTKVDRIISQLLWGNKPVCLRQNILQLPKQMGGLPSPILRIIDDKASATCTAWVQVESSSSLLLKTFLHKLCIHGYALKSRCQSMILVSTE